MAVQTDTHLVTDFGVTSLEMARAEAAWCGVIARWCIKHGEERERHRLDGIRLGPPRFVDMTAPDYDGFKGRWLSEILDA